MHGIWYTALLTALVACAIFGPAIARLPQPADGRLLWLAVIVALPLQPLAFYLVRVPLNHWLLAQLGAASPVYQWLVTLYAPVTEEAAKLIPLLLPALRREIRPENFIRYALAIGLGFALGEMWFVAERVTHVPAFAGMPFYQFGGYFGERLMTCVFHSAFVSLSLWGLNRRFALGVAGAMAMHWLGNFPIFLLAWNVGGLGAKSWGIVVQLWIAFYFIACVAMLSRFALRRHALAEFLFGRRRCPECGEEYVPSFFAVNFGTRRYERCPHCRRWHWTTPRNQQVP